MFITSTASRIHTPASQQSAATYSSFLRLLAGYVEIAGPNELAILGGRPRHGHSDVKSHWRLPTPMKPGEDIKEWRNRQPRFPSLENHQLHLRVISEKYRAIRNSRHERFMHAQRRIFSNNSEHAASEARLANEDLHRAHETDAEFFRAIAQLENAWSAKATAKVADKSGLPCEPDAGVADFCSVHSSPFERRSDLCAKQRLVEGRPDDTLKHPQFILSRKECAVAGIGVPWPVFVSDLESRELHLNDKREKDIPEKLEVLVDFSGSRGKNGGSLLSLRRPGRAADQSTRQTIIDRTSTNGGGSKGRTHTEKYGTAPSIGRGDHLVIRINQGIRLARRLERAPKANEVWMLYPHCTPWLSPEDRILVMPATYESDSGMLRLQSEEIARILARDPSLQILLEERVTGNDPAIKILFVAEPDVDEFKRLAKVAKDDGNNNAP